MNTKGTLTFTYESTMYLFNLCWNTYLWPYDVLLGHVVTKCQHVFSELGSKSENVQSFFKNVTTSLFMVLLNPLSAKASMNREEYSIGSQFLDTDRYRLDRKQPLK